MPGSSFDTTGAMRKPQVTVDPLGNRVTMGYTGRGQLASVQDSLGFITSHNLDRFGNEISRQGPYGLLLDHNPRLLARQCDSADEPLGAIWSQTVDNQNRPLVATDPLGNIATAGYDSVGNMTGYISPLGFRTTWLFNAFDLVVSTQNSLGFLFTSLYDSLGRRTARIDPLGNRASTIFNAASQIIGEQNAIGSIWSTFYDASGRQIASQTPLGFLSTQVWDSADRKIAAVDSLGNYTTAILDVNSRQIASQNALGFLNSTVYNASGWPVGAVNPLGNRSSTIFDANGHVVGQMNPLGAIWTGVLNGNGETVVTQNPLGFASTTVLDSGGPQNGRVQCTWLCEHNSLGCRQSAGRFGRPIRQYFNDAFRCGQPRYWQHEPTWRHLDQCSRWYRPADWRSESAWFFEQRGF